nr:MAG TPA: hypothetical protein [Crassvirales sp.]
MCSDHLFINFFIIYIWKKLMFLIQQIRGLILQPLLLV